MDEEGKVTQFTTMLWISRDINTKENYVSLYYGLTQETQQKVYRLFKQENVQFYPLSLKQLIENTNNTFKQQDIFYVCCTSFFT